MISSAGSRSIAWLRKIRNSLVHYPEAEQDHYRLQPVFRWNSNEESAPRAAAAQQRPGMRASSPTVVHSRSVEPDWSLERDHGETHDVNQSPYPKSRRLRTSAAGRRSHATRHWRRRTQYSHMATPQRASARPVWSMARGRSRAPAGENQAGRQDDQGQDAMRRESLRRAKAANLIVE